MKSKIDLLGQILDRETLHEATSLLHSREVFRKKFMALSDRLGGPEMARECLRTRRRMRPIKAKASRIGLAYWPALIEDHGVDIMAFVYAEAVLSKKHGLYGWRDGIFCYGGWDSKGDHGISPSQVAEMWKASGCRNSRKFQFQIAHGIIAKKGDTLPFLRNYQRGMRWIEKWKRGYVRLPRKTVAVIGRLSPEARHIIFADFGSEEWLRQSKIRIRDLDWSKVKNLERLRAEGSGRSLLIRAYLLPPRPAAVLLGLPHDYCMEHPVGQEDVHEFCPVYPKLSVRVAARVAFGTSPVAISNHLLTRKEAHQWLLAGGPSSLKTEAVRDSVIRWLVVDLPLANHIPRDPIVARWLLHVHHRGTWSALLKIRYFPNGRKIRYLDLLDEIIPEDLDRGISTGVERAFARARERLAQVNAGDHRIICSNPFGYLPRWIRLLISPAALAAEGQVMDHCVGAYTSQVETGLCWILSIVSNHGRSTVEIRRGDQGWWVAQHYGYENDTAPPRHKALLRAWLNRENQAFLRRMAV